MWTTAAAIGLRAWAKSATGSLPRKKEPEKRLGGRGRSNTMRPTTITSYLNSLSQEPVDPGFARVASALILSHARKALAEKQAITLPGLGTLRPRLGAPRKGRNPKTGEPVEIP